MNEEMANKDARFSELEVEKIRLEEMILDEMHLGSAELDEARWLRKTYETVYNPAARSRALQALTGSDAKPTASPMA